MYRYLRRLPKVAVPPVTGPQTKGEREAHVGCSVCNLILLPETICCSSRAVGVYTRLWFLKRLLQRNLRCYRGAASYDLEEMFFTIVLALPSVFVLAGLSLMLIARVSFYAISQTLLVFAHCCRGRSMVRFLRLQLSKFEHHHRCALLFGVDSGCQS